MLTKGTKWIEYEESLYIGGPILIFNKQFKFRGKIKIF